MRRLASVQSWQVLSSTFKKLDDTGVLGSDFAQSTIECFLDEKGVLIKKLPEFSNLVLVLYEEKRLKNQYLKALAAIKGVKHIDMLTIALLTFFSRGLLVGESGQAMLDTLFEHLDCGPLLTFLSQLSSTDPVLDKENGPAAFAKAVAHFTAEKPKVSEKSMFSCMHKQAEFEASAGKASAASSHK